MTRRCWNHLHFFVIAVAALLVGSAFGSNCTLLAAALSAKYNSTYHDDDFHGKSLEAFLEDHGILLTMCMRYRGMLPWLECSFGAKEDHLSASWVHKKKTKGFRVIGKPLDLGPPVGLVLKPTRTSIRCIYPVDAGTAARDDRGCGPRSYDAQYGSKGYDHSNVLEKILLRKEIIEIKNDLHGKDTRWESIPCSEFVPMPPPDPRTNLTMTPNVIGRTVPPTNGSENGLQRWEYFRLEQLSVEQCSHIMGFPICNRSMPVPPPDFDGVNRKPPFIYFGLQSWKPQDWTEAMLLMEATLNEHPTLDTWNELVLDTPSMAANDNDNGRETLQKDIPADMVQAVFYITGNGIVMDKVARALAQRVARTMGKKMPVLYVKGSHAIQEEDGLNTDIDVHGDLFRCDPHDNADAKGVSAVHDLGLRGTGQKSGRLLSLSKL